MEKWEGMSLLPHYERQHNLSFPLFPSHTSSESFFTPGSTKTGCRRQPRAPTPPSAAVRRPAACGGQMSFNATFASDCFIASSNVSSDAAILASSSDCATGRSLVPCRSSASTTDAIVIESMARAG